MKRPSPDFELERMAMANGATCVVGVDEVGRGPIAGPVTAAAVWLDPTQIPDGLNDSKKLTEKRREALFVQIAQTAKVCVAHASVEEIDTINIRQATFLAMRRAVAGLGLSPDHLLIDGRDVPDDMPCPGEAVIKGDGRSVSIAAASIMAKVTRDRLMVDLAQQHPGYGWEANAGYPTKSHISALIELGVTQHHRQTFGPVHKILCNPEN
ncbi:MAG: ribonuclease HII [Brevirhabdus sp.]